MGQPMEAEVHKPEMLGKFEKYEVERAADTLIDAEEVKANKELFKEAGKIISKKKAAINSIADLRERAQELGDEENSEKEDEETTYKGKRV